MTNDKSLDNQLDEFVKFWIPEYRGVNNPQETAKSAIKSLIAQAVLEGKIEENKRYLKMFETGKWRSLGIEVTDRLTTLQAQVEKGKK